MLSLPHPFGKETHIHHKAMAPGKDVLFLHCKSLKPSNYFPYVTGPRKFCLLRKMLDSVSYCELSHSSLLLLCPWEEENVQTDTESKTSPGSTHKRAPIQSCFTRSQYRYRSKPVSVRWIWTLLGLVIYSLHLSGQGTR